MQPSVHEFRPKPRTALAHQPAVNERFRPARQHGRARGCADERLVPVDGVGAQEAHRIADKCVKRQEWSSETTAHRMRMQWLRAFVCMRAPVTAG